MTERTVTIKVGIEGAPQLQDLKKQLEAIKANSRIRLSIGASGLDQAQKALTKTRAESRGIIKDLDALGGALSDKAIKPLAQYQTLLGAALQATRLLGTGSVSALQRASMEFQRQKTLAQFWGTSGYLAQGITTMRHNLSDFMAGSGSRFTGWLQDSAAGLAQYRTALVASAAAMLGFAAAAGLSSKHAQNYIKSTLDTRLMARKLTDRAGAEAWIQSAQSADWSAGRESRMGVFQTVLSKNPQIGQKFAQKATEDIEKFFFANQEMLAKKGFTSAEQLASAISAPVLSGEDATKFEDIFGLGFSKMTATARLSRLSTEAPNDEELQKALAMRPDEIMTKRLNAATAAIGDSTIPVLNQILGLFLGISDAVGKIPGLPQAIAWGTMLTGAAAGGGLLLSVIGSLIPGFVTSVSLIRNLSLATRAATAAQWLLNAAMTANPIGLAIVGIAALVAGLYLLEKKFGIVTKAYQAFAGSNIGKSFLAWIGEGKKALTDLLTGKGAGKAIKFGLDIRGNASPLMKVQLMLFEYLRKIWSNSSTLNKLISTGMGYWSKIADFVIWLLGMISSGLQWIRDGLGVTKQEKKERMDEAAAKKGVEWVQESKGSWFNGPGWYKKNASNIGTKIEDPQLDRLKEDYERAPKGFFEEIPGITTLTKAIQDLTYALKNPTEIAKDAADNATQAAVGIGEKNLAASQERYNAAIAAGEGNYFAAQKAWRPWFMPGGGLYDLPGLAAGGSIKSTGGLIGHGGEEIDSAATVEKGETVLSRINALVGRGGGAGSGHIINVNLHQEINASAISSDVDINRLISRISDEGADRLIFALRNKLDNMSSRGIGYMRG